MYGDSGTALRSLAAGYSHHEISERRAAFERCSVPFFDSFAGAREPFLDTAAIEADDLPPRWTRIIKLHGWVVVVSFVRALWRAGPFGSADIDQSADAVVGEVGEPKGGGDEPTEARMR